MLYFVKREYPWRLLPKDFPPYSMVHSFSGGQEPQDVAALLGGIKGRRCHRVVDSEGRLLTIKVHAANKHDTIAGGEVFKETTRKYPNLLGVCGDEGYRGTFADFITKGL